MFTKEDLQKLFDSDFDEIREADEDELDFIEQSHPGDMLIEIAEDGAEKCRLWRNLDCNGGGIEIEYFGFANGYKWETVFNES